MTDYRRLRVPGGTYFFTVCLEDRASTALTDNIDRLRHAYARTVAELPVTCVAMVVLPDHLHAVWTLPEGDADFSERWRRIKARFSHHLRADLAPCRSKLEKRERGLWQRRFWEHRVRSEDNLGSAISYCHQNPVKHGLVADPADWPFSSFHRDLRKDGQNCPSYAPPGFPTHPALAPARPSRDALAHAYPDPCPDLLPPARHGGPAAGA